VRDTSDTALAEKTPNKQKRALLFGCRSTSKAKMRVAFQELKNIAT